MDKIFKLLNSLNSLIIKNIKVSKNIPPINLEPKYFEKNKFV